MKLVNKNILLVSPENWNHIFVSKHHYATHLANRGNNVFFLNPPKTGRYEIKDTEFENLYSIQYPRFVKGLRFFPTYLIQKALLKVYLKIEDLCQVKFDIIWSFDNSVFFDFNFLPHSVFKISHIVDLNQDFNFRKAAKSANLCIAVSHFILEKLLVHNKVSHFINHGYNNSALKKGNDKIESCGKNKIKVALIGNMAMAYIDWKILKQVCNFHSDVDFLFIGPNSIEFSTELNHHHCYKKDLSSFKNAFFLGQVASNSIPNILNQVDVLLVSYKEEHHYEQSNSHKMMEYLSSGKVVMATKTMEYNTLAEKGIIAMSDKNKDFPRLFNEVINNLDNWNNNEMRKQRMNYASNNTYDKQIDRIEKIISTNLKF
jgi:hypothetical protein